MALNFDNEKRVEISPADDRIFSPWVNPGKGLSEELNSYEREFYVLYPSQSALANVGGNIFIWGHGNYSDMVGNDRGQKESLRSRQLATVLQSSGLPMSYDGDLVVWSCWGGVPGGIAQGLLLSLRNRGYQKLRVWGALYLTGAVYNRIPLVYKLPQYRVVGDDEILPFGTGQTLTAAKGDPSYAKRGDLRCYPAP